MPAARRLLIALVFLATPLRAGASPLLDADFLGFPVGPSPSRLAAGDLTGDGVDDLVVGDDSGLACMVARGDGEFGPLVRLDNRRVSAVVIAELTGDAIPDIAADCADEARILVFRGLGGGAFEAPSSISFRSGSAGLLARDLDGDGRADIVASDPASRSIWIWFASPGGGFSAPAVVAANVPPGRILSGDIDGDGAPDLFLLHANAQSGFTLLRNDGHGGFAPPVLYAGPGGSRTGTTGDFNGDGVPDVAIPVSYQYPEVYEISVWSGHRDGTFSGPVQVPTCGIAEGCAAGDLDGDHIDDLVVAGPRFQCVHLGWPGGLMAPISGRSALQATAPVVTGRFDADSNVDVAAVELAESGGGISLCSSTYQPATVFTWRGDGNGGFLHAPVVAPSGASRVLAVDLDQDGNVDLVAPISGGSAGIMLVRGRGDGTFDVPQVSTTVTNVRSIVAVDADGDGRPELAAIAGGRLSVLEADGPFGLRVRTSRVVGSNAFEVIAADFDRDGRPELALTNSVAPSAVEIFPSGPDLATAAPKLLPLPLRPRSLAAADLDRDGIVDLLVGADDQFGFSPRLLSYRGTPDGTFALRDSLGLDATPLQLAVWDRNGRVDPTVIVGQGGISCPDDMGVLILRSVAGVFARDPGSLDSGGKALATALADVDGDGLPDLLVAASRGRIALRPGRPDGTFGARRDFGLSARVGPIAVADFDEDGRPDVAALTQAGIALLANRGGAVYSPPDVAARLGAGGSETLLSYGDIRPLPLVIAGTDVVDARAIDPASVRLAGARPIPGRVRLADGIVPESPALDQCATVYDDLDAKLDLEVQFRSDEVLDGWLRTHATECPCRDGAVVVQLPFTARRVDGTTIVGTACAVVAGDPGAEEQSSSISMRAFGVAPDFEAGVGVMLSVPKFSERADVFVFDVAGRRVGTLHRGSLGPGLHRLTWHGDGEAIGPRPGPGIYFVRADVDGVRLKARILVAR